MPYPRGIVIVGEKLYVLARGRSREVGGVSTTIDDHAGTIYEVDPEVSTAVDRNEIPEKIKKNGVIFAAPTNPPFYLLDRKLEMATSDRATDRPYCVLRYDDASQNFFICAFSGIDGDANARVSFTKNGHDAILRYDARSKRWSEVERHNNDSGFNYPHHDTAANPVPHGWLKGPDNCLVVGKWLYVTSKDNSLLVRYDISQLSTDPDSGFLPSEVVMGSEVQLRDGSREVFEGHSALAVYGEYLYVGYRTSSAVVRFPLNNEGSVEEPIMGEVIAKFEAFDAETRRSANITDIGFDDEGRLYILSAQPAKVWRLNPDRDAFLDARLPTAKPYLDLAEMTGNPKMKSENILIDKSMRIYITSSDAYDADSKTHGALYRYTPQLDNERP